MIALDTNVLVRLVMRDDDAQAEHARALFEREAGRDGLLFVADVVVAGFAWVLKSRYALADADIARALRAILDNASLQLQSRAAVAAALRLFEQGGSDFPDCFIVAQADLHGCAAVVSFDRGMRGLPGVEPL